MAFKKGDIVEVIRTDYWDGFTYCVGTKWEVIDYSVNSRYFVQVLDPRQENGYALLYKSRVKQFKEEK